MGAWALRFLILLLFASLMHLPPRLAWAVILVAAAIAIARFLYAGNYLPRFVMDVLDRLTDRARARSRLRAARAAHRGARCRGARRPHQIPADRPGRGRRCGGAPNPAPPRDAPAREADRGVLLCRAAGRRQDLLRQDPRREALRQRQGAA